MCRLLKQVIALLAISLTIHPAFALQANDHANILLHSQLTTHQPFLFEENLSPVADNFSATSLNQIFMPMVLNLEKTQLSTHHFLPEPSNTHQSNYGLYMSWLLAITLSLIGLGRGFQFT